MSGDNIVRQDWGDGRTPFAPEPAVAELPSTAIMSVEEGQAIVAEAEAHANGRAYDAGPSLDPALLATWDSEGGSDRHLKTAQSAAESILSGVADPAGFQQGFDALSQEAQTAIFDTLRMDRAKGMGEATMRALRDRLSPQSRQEVARWYDSLDEDTMAVVDAYVDGKL